MRTPESTALNGEGASEWAGGSHAWKGHTALLTPKAAPKRRRTARAYPGDAAPRDAATPDSSTVPNVT